MTDLISNLKENFGGTPDTSTIKGIRLYCEMWLSGEVQAKPRELQKACQTMIQNLNGAIAATEADLESTGETVDSLAEPVERSLQAYERLQEILEDMKEAVGRGNKPEVQPLLEELIEAAAFLREAQQDLQAWVEEDVLKCPKCGGTEEDPCSFCGLDLMYLDPTAGASSTKAPPAILPPEYGELYSTVLAIRDGQRPLRDLGPRVQVVEKNVNRFFSAVSSALHQSSDSTNLEAANECLRCLKEGLVRLKESQSDRKITTLQEGWAQVFQEAVKLQELRINLLEEFGGEAERKIAASERAAQPVQDLFTLSGED